VNPELAAIGALYRHCREVDVKNGDEAGSWWTAQEIYSEIEEQVKANELFGYFEEYYFDKGVLNRRKTGKLIRRWKNRRIDGLTLKIDESDSNPNRHRIKFSLN
jgi:hypothetical protein